MTVIKQIKTRLACFNVNLMFPKIDSHLNILANFKIFQNFKKFQNSKIKKNKKNVIIILKNDKTSIAYFFPVFKKIIKQ